MKGLKKAKGLIVDKMKGLRKTHQVLIKCYKVLHANNKKVFKSFTEAYGFTPRSQEGKYNPLIKHLFPTTTKKLTVELALLIESILIVTT